MQSVHGAGRQMDFARPGCVWFLSGTSLRLVVSNLGTFAVSFPLPPPFSLTGDQSATDWFLGHLFSALSDLQAPQCCPQITVWEGGA